MSQELRYSIGKEQLPKALRSVVVPFEQDEALTSFLADCQERPHTALDMTRLFCLSLCTDPYNAHAVLGLYPMHLLSAQQWETLVPKHLHGGRLLDIGAGQGFVTEHARALFSEIVAVETAPAMVRRLKARGFSAHCADITVQSDLLPRESFDVVSVLNVLDRCVRPRTLLNHACQFLSPGGVLIISDPLPLEQRVRGNTRVPKEQLGAHSGTWEECLSEFYTNVLVPESLTPVAVTRTPYVYKSTGKPGFEALDDFVIVCKKDTATKIQPS